VCKYNAGTDTNPIFLFNLAHIEGDVTEVNAFEEDAAAAEDSACAAGLAQKVEAAARLPDTQAGRGDTTILTLFDTIQFKIMAGKF
jgi:hypothetical protein